MSDFPRMVGIAVMLTTCSLACGQASAAHLFVSPFGNDGTGTGSANHVTEGALIAAL